MRARSPKPAPTVAASSGRRSRTSSAPYACATRSQSENRYHEIEPWAWSRLMQRLRAINARRARLRPAAA